MEEEILEASIRKFLRMVGVSSQRAIEEAISRALQDGTIQDVEGLPVSMTLMVPHLDVRVTFNGELKLRQPSIGPRAALTGLAAKLSPPWDKVAHRTAVVDGFSQYRPPHDAVRMPGTDLACARHFSGVIAGHGRPGLH